MQYETISRHLYLSLIRDGVRVDRIRKLVTKLKGVAKVNTMPLPRVIFLIEFALMDTDSEKMKLQNLDEQIRLAETELE